MIEAINIPIYGQGIDVSDEMPEKYKSDYKAVFEYETQILYYQPGLFTPAQIAHECVHIANWVCERCGILLEYRNDEAFAYLVGFFFDSISAIVNKRGAA